VIDSPREKRRPLSELRIRARKALSRADLIEIASSNTPSTSYDLALQLTGDEKVSQAVRWLAMIRRDHGETEFLAFTQAEK
jgi:hypothetical protein